MQRSQIVSSTEPQTGYFFLTYALTDPEYYKHRMTTFAGFPYTFSEKKTFDDSPEEREAFFQKLWDNGRHLCNQ